MPTYSTLTTAQKEVVFGSLFCAENGGSRSSGLYSSNNGDLTFVFNWTYDSDNYDGTPKVASGDAIALGLVSWTGTAAKEFCGWIATNMPSYWAVWPQFIKDWYTNVANWWTIELSYSQAQELRTMYAAHVNENAQSQIRFFYEGAAGECLPTYCAVIDRDYPLDDVKSYFYFISCYLWAPLFAQDIYSYLGSNARTVTLPNLRDAALYVYDNWGWSGHYYDAGLRNRLRHYAYDCLEDWDGTSGLGFLTYEPSYAGNSGGDAVRYPSRIMEDGNQLRMLFNDGNMLFFRRAGETWIPNVQQAASLGGVPYPARIDRGGNELVTTWSDGSRLWFNKCANEWLARTQKTTGSGGTSQGVTPSVGGLPGIAQIFQFVQNNRDRYTYAFDVYGNYPGGTGIRPLDPDATNYLDCSWFVSMMVANFSTNAWNNAGYSEYGYAPDCSGLWENTQELWTKPQTLPAGILPGDIFLMSTSTSGIYNGRHVMMYMPDGYFWDVSKGWSSSSQPRNGGPNNSSGGIRNSFDAVLRYYISGLYYYWCINRFRY